MDLDQIQRVGPEAFQAGFDLPHGAVVRPVSGLGRQEHFRASRRAGEETKVFFTTAVLAVDVGGVEEVDPGVDRLCEKAEDGLLVGRVRDDPVGAQPEDRDLDTSSAQHPAWKRRWYWRRW